MDKSSTSLCLQCERPLQGRLDKKFCSNQCRSTYHNNHKRTHEQAITKVNSQIRKNRTILKTLCPVGKATVRKEVLTSMGFSFRHFTSMFRDASTTYFLCYDFAYSPIVERSISEGIMVQKVLIVQYQTFMKNFDPWKFVKL